MVYCGKPSKGCQLCRDKKTRCDRQTPSCGQCLRANRSCPGYRSQLDLMFRNESDAVIVKAKAREKSKKPKSSPPPQSEPFEPLREIVNVKQSEDRVTDFSEFRAETHQGLYLQAMLPNCSMFPTREERGLAFGDTLLPMWLPHAELLDGISNQSNPEEHLLASMSAVGLAGFANSVHAPELMVQARKNYVNALQLTNSALRSPTEAKKDSTLFAVMILGIFETITGNNERSLAAWTEHINGAAALVKLRGSSQFKNTVGQRMFLQVTGSLMLSCVQRMIAMPQHMVDLRKDAEEYLGAESPAWKSSGVIIDFTIFRSNVRDCKIVGPKAIIEAALEIDGRFVEILENLPEEWKYDTVYTDKTPHLIWNGRYHVYNESWMARIYNGIRTCRILLHEIVRDQLLAASTAMTPIFPLSQMILQGEKSVAVMLELQAEILASIPHHVPSNLFDSTSGLLEGSRSYFVLWPLYLVGSMDLTTGPIRQWTAARLRDIGTNMGIRQALLVADYLENAKHIKVWDTKPDLRPKWNHIGNSDQNFDESTSVWEKMDHEESMPEDSEEHALLEEGGSDFFQSYSEQEFSPFSTESMD